MIRFNTANIENTSYSMLAKCKQMLMGGGKNDLLKLGKGSFNLFYHAFFISLNSATLL